MLDAEHPSIDAELLHNIMDANLGGLSAAVVVADAVVVVVGDSWHIVQQLFVIGGVAGVVQLPHCAGYVGGHNRSFGGL